MYREITETHYFCARCGKEIKGKRTRERVRFEQIILEGDRIVAILGSKFRDRGIYLCPKCVKDFSSFIKNEYPKDQSEREKMLEDKLREVTEEFSKDIELINQGILALNGLSQMMNIKINGSPYEDDKDKEYKYLCSKLEVFRFIDELTKKPEESEGKDNE